LVHWEESVTWCVGVAIFVEVEAVPEREKGGDDVSWADTNLTGSKNKENTPGRFSYFK
jgi:hypothetical protein